MNVVGQLAVLTESIPVVWFLFTQLSAPVGFGMCVFNWVEWTGDYV